ncbi:MAG: hypothetical protein FJX77_17535 [Armatimonadetes bacterium]|nr:hypothetical protein [Armatimonadota bacterium]
MPFHGCKGEAARLQFEYARLDSELDEPVSGGASPGDRARGITLVARAPGITRQRIYQGLRDLTDRVRTPPTRPTRAPPRPARIRCPGSGRKRLAEKDPELVREREALIEPTTRDDPLPPRRWTCKTTAKLTAGLTARRHPVSHHPETGPLTPGRAASRWRYPWDARNGDVTGLAAMPTSGYPDHSLFLRLAAQVPPLRRNRGWATGRPGAAPKRCEELPSRADGIGFDATIGSRLARQPAVPGEWDDERPGVGESAVCRGFGFPPVSPTAPPQPVLPQGDLPRANGGAIPDCR